MGGVFLFVSFSLTSLCECVYIVQEVNDHMFSPLCFSLIWSSSVKCRMILPYYTFLLFAHYGNKINCYIGLNFGRMQGIEDVYVGELRGNEVVTSYTLLLLVMFNPLKQQNLNFYPQCLFQKSGKTINFLWWYFYISLKV